MIGRSGPAPSLRFSFIWTRPPSESEGAAPASDRPLRLGPLRRSQARQIKQLSRAPGAARCRGAIVGPVGRRVEDGKDAKTRKMLAVPRLVGLSHRTMSKATLTLSAACYGVRWQFGWQRNAVASTSAQEVYSEIGRIAHMDLPLREQRAEAAKRITQFKADLAAARIQPREAETLKENLRRVLQRGATQHNLTTERNSVYAEALDVLMGQAR